MYTAPSEESPLKDEWIPLNKRDHLSFLHILGIAVGNLAPHLLFVVIPALFAPLAYLLHVSSLAQTFILFYGSFAGFACSPLVGVYSDSCMFRKGRRRIFICIGSVFMIIGFLLMTYCVEIGQFFVGKDKDALKVQQALFILSYMIAVTAGNIANAPTRTICSDCCPPSQQSLMANICSVFHALGGIMVNLFGGIKLYSYTSLGQEQFLLIVSTSLIIFSICITIIVAREEPLHDQPPKVRPFRRIFGAIKNIPKPFLRAAIPYLMAQMALFQFNFGFSHFMGSDIFEGNNAIDADPDAKKKYQDGLSWAMMCNVARFGTQFLYGFVNAKICEWIGMKLTTIIGYSFLAGGLLTFFWVNNKYFYLVIPILIGSGYAVAMSVPYAIVSLVAPKNEFGANIGILMMCTVLGEQLSNFGVGRGFGLIWKDSPRKMIGISSIFGFIGAILSFWLIEPKVEKANAEYASIADCTTDNDQLDSGKK